MSREVTWANMPEEYRLDVVVVVHNKKIEMEDCSILKKLCEEREALAKNIYDILHDIPLLKKPSKVKIFTGGLFDSASKDSFKNYSLVEAVWNDNNKLDILTPREFEELICELIKKQGFNAELTPQTRDGGKDIIVRHNVLGEMKIYVECKRYNPNKKRVGSEILQKLIGIMDLEGAAKAIIYTTSFFTSAAKKIAKDIRNRLTLYDRRDLLLQIDTAMCTA